MKRFLVGVLLTAACAPSWRHAPHDQMFQRTPPPVLHDAPPERGAWEWWNLLLHSAIEPAANTLVPGNQLEETLEPWLGGDEAEDVNDFGQVPDSVWFVNRIGKRVMTLEEVARGPDTMEGPADGKFHVLAAKSGVTPGLIVRDSAGDRWIVKFDAPWLPEMGTAAEVIGTKLLHAAGYHVPENHLVRFGLGRLTLSPEATRRDKYNRERPLTADDLRETLQHLNPEPDGRVRATFSRFVPGQPVGPFSFRGWRKDDPNDDIPHQRRRTLRGLEVFASWLNDTSVKAENTLSTFIVPDGSGQKGYLRHYLLDFNGMFGSSENREKFAAEGFRHEVDWTELAARYFSAGLYYPPWLRVRRSPYRSIGIFEAEVFDPRTWRPAIPNPAFDEATPRDLYWAGTILARMDRPVIAAAVATGQLSETGAASYLVDVLMDRRQQVLAYVFSRVLPLDFPRMTGTVLSMEDLAATAGLLSEADRTYGYRVTWTRRLARDCVVMQGEARGPAVDLAPALDIVRAAGLDDDPFVTVSWRRGLRATETHVRVRVTETGALPVGLVHDVQ